MTVQHIKINCLSPRLRWVFQLCFALSLGCFLPTPGVADDTTWYQVEVVVFRHTGANALTQELFLNPLDPVNPAGAVDLQWFDSEAAKTSDSALTFRPADRKALPFFRPLPSSGNSLEPIRLALSRRSGYQVIGMTGWQQAGLPQNNSYPVFVRLGEQRWFTQKGIAREEAATSIASTPSLEPTPSPELARELAYAFEGTINVYRERFLHIQTQLIYRHAYADLPAEITQMLSSQQDLAVPLRHQRRARSNETHYLDNPVVGMIVRITSLE